MNKALSKYFTKVGANIRKRRMSKSLTLKWLADKSGLSIETVADMEDGLMAASNKCVSKVAHALGCHANDLYPPREDQ